MMEKEVYEQLPAVAVRAVVPIPHNEFRIEVGSLMKLYEKQCIF